MNQTLSSDIWISSLSIPSINMNAKAQMSLPLPSFTQDAFKLLFYIKSQMHVSNSMKNYKRESWPFTSHHLKINSKWSFESDRLSRIWLFATVWTVTRQAPLSMGFSRQGYWSGLPFPSPGSFSSPRIKPGSPALQADSYHLSHQGRNSKWR